MDDGNFVHVKVHAAASAAVEFVAEDGMAHMSHMAADLVSAPGVEFYLKQTHLAAF